VLGAAARAAVALFDGWPVAESVPQDETTLEEFAAAQRAGLLWVARAEAARVVMVWTCTPKEPAATAAR
jgi:hypothetical protein